MIRGVSIQIPNEYGTSLYEVLQPININLFIWGVFHFEDYTANEKVKGLQSNFIGEQDMYILDGEDLQKIIRNPLNYLISAELQAYVEADSIEKIDNYAGFCKSKCELIFLLYDNVFVEIYCKSQDTSMLLYKNAEKYHFKNIEYITDENDLRTNMRIY